MKGISPNELFEKIKNKDSNFILIDIREPDERQSMYIKEAVSIPMPEIQHHLEELTALAATKEIIIHCASGKRSQWLCGRLASHTITATNLLGGILGWIGSGYPYETAR